MTQQWHATLTVRRWSAEPTEDQLAELTRALPGFGVVADDGETRVTLSLSFPAQSARTAAEAAIRAARTAWTQAIGSSVDITALWVMTEEDWTAEIAHPGRQDLIGKSEAAQLLRVSPQRVDELSRTREDFPGAVATPKMGPIYTRASIEAFDERWDRRRTGRPRKTATT